MAIYALGDVDPDIHPEAYVSPDATVIGNVTVSACRMALGVPARIREGYEVPESAWGFAVEHDVANGKRYRAELRRLDA